MYFPCILNLITKQVLTSILFIYLFHWSACLNNLVVVSVPTYWRNAISVNTLDSIKQFVSCAVRFTYFSTIFNVLYVTASHICIFLRTACENTSDFTGKRKHYDDTFRSIRRQIHNSKNSCATSQWPLLQSTTRKHWLSARQKVLRENPQLFHDCLYLLWLTISITKICVVVSRHWTLRRVHKEIGKAPIPKSEFNKDKDFKQSNYPSQ